MKFTATELRSIESTTDKLASAALALCDRTSTNGTNARHMAYIISELRACADLMASDDRSIRVAAADRLVALIAN